MKSALAILFASVLVVACTSSRTNDGSLTICRNLPTDSVCAVNMAYLSCTFENDAGQEQNETCLSDNVNDCPDGTGLGGCNNQCKPGSEYAAVCVGASDGAGSMRVAPPSADCRALATDVNVYCCPCGS